MAIMSKEFEAVELLIVEVLLSKSEFKVSQLSELMSTLKGLYLLLRVLKLVSSIILDTLIT